MADAQKIEEKIEERRDRGSVRTWTIIIAIATIAGVLVILGNQGANALMDRTTIVDRVQQLETGSGEIKKKLEMHDGELKTIETDVAVMKNTLTKIDERGQAQDKKLDRLLEHK